MNIIEGFRIAVVRGSLGGEYNFLLRNSQAKDPIAAKVLISMGETVKLWPYLPEGVGVIKINDQIEIRRPGLNFDDLEKSARWNLEELGEYIESDKWVPLARRVIRSRK